jgi:carbon monoxide dehydrogenase subunit G
MEMQGKRQLAITQQQAWEALNDPQMLKLCIPGCNAIEASGENRYAITVALKIGPLSAKFNGKIALENIQAPVSYAIAFDGQGGVAGFGKGNASVQLTPNAQGCELGYSVHATVGGKVAQLGQRLIDGAAKSMAEDFFHRFDSEMQARYPQAYAAQNGMAQVQVTRASGGSLPGWVWVVALVVVVIGVWARRAMG